MILRTGIALAILPVAASFACASQSARRVTINESDYASYATPGTGQVSGHVFIRVDSKQVWEGAGVEVYLDAVTPFSTEWFEKSIRPGEKVESQAERNHRPSGVQWAADPVFQRYRRTITSDPEANFKFDRVPAGEYFVTSLVLAPGSRRKGGWTYARIKVARGESVRAIVTRPGESTP